MVSQEKLEKARLDITNLGELKIEIEKENNFSLQIDIVYEGNELDKLNKQLQVIIE